MKRFANIFIGLYLYILSICIAVIIVLNNTLFFKAVIKIFNLSEETQVSSSCIYNDYKKIISYINNPWLKEIKFDNFTLSKNAMTHFSEVRTIFQAIYLFTVISLILIIIIALRKHFHNKVYKLQYLNILFYTTIISIVVLSVFSIFSFKKLFKLFHTIVFNNDYWIFDTINDSIINILPMEYFLICLIRILIIIFTISLISKIIYNTSCKKIKE